MNKIKSSAIAIALLSVGLVIFYSQNPKIDPLVESAQRRFPKIYRKSSNGEKIEIKDPKLKKFYQIRAFKAYLLNEERKRNPRFYKDLQNQIIASNSLKIVRLSQELENEERTEDILVKDCGLMNQETSINNEEKLTDFCIDDYLNPGGWDPRQDIVVTVIDFDPHSTNQQVQKDWGRHLTKEAEERVLAAFRK